MAGWNGSGVFSRTHDWTDDQANGILITASRHDANDVDFVNGLNNCMTKDGQNSATSNLNMGSNRLTALASATALTDAVAATQIVNNSLNYATSGGSGNTYTLSLAIAPSAYAAGQLFSFKANHASTGAATLNVNALGAKAITKLGDSTAIAANDIVIDQIVVVQYDGTQFQMMFNPENLAAARTTLGIPMPNLLINGGFRVWQRGTTFNSTTTPANNDDTYLADRWVLLSDGNDIADVSQETTIVPTGSYASIKLDVETANKKFGLLQILEAKDAAAIIGGTASLSFKAEKVVGNTTLETLRAAVISWDSTEDTVTSDVVSAWNAAGADPTLVANWTYENTPSNLTLTDSFQTFTIENISIDTASTANVAVFIWVDDADATVGDLAYITDVKLESEAVATDYVNVPIQNELEICQRYYYRRTFTASENVGNCQAFSTSAVFGKLIDLPTTMRIQGTVSVSAVGDFSFMVASGASGQQATTFAPTHRSDTIQIPTSASGLTGLVAGNCSIVRAAVNAYIDVSAEL